jgi:hypothetical protein
MKTGKIERVERTTYLLEMGIDFQANDLEVIASNGVDELRGLNKEFRTNAFYELNIGKLVWSGHFDKQTQTIQVTAEKQLFI